MNSKWLQLVAAFLDKASDKFANHGCNDWEFPKDWTLADRQELVKAIWADDGSLADYDPKRLYVPDWLVMRFLANQLKESDT